MTHRAPHPFDAYKSPLYQRTVIEASAGTGKTYSIIIIALRLLLEGKKNGKGIIPIEKILISTFTRSATAELKDRMRRRLVEAETLLCAPENEKKSGDNAAFENWLFFLRDIIGEAELLRRVRQALFCINDAAIYTIHSFCQHVLNEFAFESGSTYSLSLIEDDSGWLHSAAEDFVRRRIAAAPPEDLEILRQSGFSTPEDFAALARVREQKKEALLLDPCPGETPELARGELITALGFFKKQKWQKEADLILQPENCDGRRAPAEKLINQKAVVFSALNACCSGDFTFAELEVILDYSGLFSSEKNMDKPIFKTAYLNGNPDVLTHPFFKAIDALTHSWKNYKKTLLHAYAAEFIQTYPEIVRKVKAARNECSFNDLIENLHRALASSDSGSKGEALAEALRGRYHAVLIDEFQDTDSRQYFVFHKVFGACADFPLFLIGDPKQAIYAFRGGDIYTYRKAVHETKKRFTLTINYRSSPRLLAGCNEIFGEGKENPFAADFISYHRAAAPENAAEKLLLRNIADERPLKYIYFNEDGTGASKESATLFFQKWISAEIQKLLGQASRKELLYCGRPLEPCHIAVLVDSNGEAAEFQHILRQDGIPAVIASIASVFSSSETADVYRLLSALVNPASEKLIRGAALSPLCGLPASKIAVLDRDNAARTGLTDYFNTLSHEWRRNGFYRMFSQILMDPALRARIAAAKDGDRKMTNYLHLAELLHAQERSTGRNPEKLLLWLAGEINECAADGDKELRLETDADAVKILTIHKSKGLEFPVIFCPGLWRKWRKPERAAAVHSPENARELLAFGNFESNIDGESFLELHQRESIAENRRHFYVALTRAAERLYVFWANFNSRLQGQNTMAGSYFLADTGQYRKSEYIEFIETSQITETDETAFPSYRVPLTEPDQIAAVRIFKRQLEENFRITSFSGLLESHDNGSPEPETEVASRLDNSTEDNKDIADVSGIAVKNNRSVEKSPLDPGRWDALPKGNITGLFLHAILEQTDFAAGVVNEVIRKLAEDYFPGIPELDEIQAAAAEMVNAALKVQIPENSPGCASFCLAEIQQRISELEFYFPLGELRSTECNAFLKRQRNQVFSTLPAGPVIHPQNVTGFMRGFIDLVFMHNGRYYLADWKSNALEDYSRSEIEREMVSSGYDIQYLIYSVALHRFLLSRLNNYRYAEHFGGVYYFFLRGLSRNTGVVTSEPPVFSARPDEQVIREFETILCGENR